MVGGHESVPRDILMLPGVALKLFGDNTSVVEPSNSTGNDGLSPAASLIINNTFEHQRDASYNRLGKSKPILNKGLAKISTMRVEKAERTKEHGYKDVGIQITAAIWVLPGKRLGAKMQQVCDNS